MFSYRFIKCKGLKQCPNEIKYVEYMYTEYMLMIFSLYLNQLKISQNFMNILTHVIQICLFHLNKK